MKCPKQMGLLLMAIVAVVLSVPSEQKSRSAISTRERRRITNKGIHEINSTTLDLLDVRTPPKVKEQQKKIHEKFEFSHPGVAIPVDENIILAEATTTSENVLTVEHKTSIDDGPSSWILLSGLSSTTSTPSEGNNASKKNSTNEVQWNSTISVTGKPKRNTYSHFKKRVNVVTSERPFEKVTITESHQAKVHKDVTNLTRIKASELNKAVIKRNSSQHDLFDNSSMLTNSNTKTKESHNVSSHIISSSTSNTTAQAIKLTNSTMDAGVNVTKLSAEAKDIETDLVSTIKKKKNSTKRKKNKNRRRKPTETKGDITTVSKPSKVSKQKPISTQIYSYLSREVMPTVGVGLVGLMVTAGLASYFFYPFGIARRSYNVDRKDHDGDYYYKNELSVPEEEAIGKVIAGMSTNTLFPDNLQRPKHKERNSNIRYRLVDKKTQINEGMHGSVEDVPLTYDKENEEQSYYNTYQTIDYSSDPNENKLFVAAPEKAKNAVTPVTVPEHGPRNLNSADEDMEKMSDKQKSKLETVHGPRYLGNGRRK
ncbi:unnamed protein product [Phaedon cochleariae]|uniref:Uncharacterized protein n=1 Tax=Phaedon cochleariae TaxID=80249 RepID=A0A9N9SHA7_PHACE|nr:unnamed protein product [Phaedon cochleariae]